MWKKVALAAALGIASTQLAFAQSVDPSGANRGYPVYAQPDTSAYYMGQLQGGGSGALAVPYSPGFESRPAALPRYGRPWVGPDYPSAAPGWGGQQDEIGVDLQDRASSPYAGGTG